LCDAEIDHPPDCHLDVVSDGSKDRHVDIVLVQR